MAPEEMNGAAFRLKFLELCKAHLVVEKANIPDVAKVCEVVKAYLQQKARALVASAKNEPVLFTYRSDATPLLVGTTLSRRLQGRRFVRKAGERVRVLGRARLLGDDHAGRRASGGGGLR